MSAHVTGRYEVIKTPAANLAHTAALPHVVVYVIGDRYSAVYGRYAHVQSAKKIARKLNIRVARAVEAIDQAKESA